MIGYLKLIIVQLSAQREAVHLCAFPDVVILGFKPRIHSEMPAEDIILSEQTPNLGSRNGSPHGAALVPVQARA
jgi:hypothetical protein